MKKIFLGWFPVIIFGSVIFYLSSKPIQSPVLIAHADLAVHGFLYGLLAFLLARALNLKERVKKQKFILFTILTASLYGALIEWYQAYIPTRTSSVADALANTTGALLGVFLYVIFRKKRVREIS